MAVFDSAIPAADLARTILPTMASGTVWAGSAADYHLNFKLKHPSSIHSLLRFVCCSIVEAAFLCACFCCCGYYHETYADSYHSQRISFAAA